MISDARCLMYQMRNTKNTRQPSTEQSLNAEIKVAQIRVERALENSRQENLWRGR
jgi:hypothetical protein